MSLSRRSTTAALLLVSAMGCRAQRPWPPEPSDVRLGEESCASCSMIISDDRFAAQLRTPDGALSVFDDVGCLLTKVDRSRPDARGVFVRAFDGSGWVRGDRAMVVRSSDFHSPMGFGLATFASREAAVAAASRHPHARVVPLDGLIGAGTPDRAPTPPVPHHRDPHHPDSHHHEER
jgi:copper chaperone NosL